jgi:hypothetical protein
LLFSKEVKMATRYVEITREDLEAWMKSQGYKFTRNQQTAGIYFIEVSPLVGIKLSSTIGSSGAALDVGKASMNLSLVSLLHGHLLNKKDAAQSLYQRTKNWKETWAKGILHWRMVYQKAPAFYDNIARVKDRDAYREKWLKAISQAGISDSFIDSLKEQLQSGKILTEKQEQALIKSLDSAPSKVPQNHPQFSAPEVKPSNDRRKTLIGLIEAYPDDINQFRGYLSLLKNGESLTEANVRELYKRLVEANFYANEGYDGETEIAENFADHLLKLIGGFKPLPAESPDKVEAPNKPFTPQQQAFIKRLETLKDKARTNAWLTDFLDSILRQINQGKALSDKQKEVIMSNLVKYQV